MYIDTDTHIGTYISKYVRELVCLYTNIVMCMCVCVSVHKCVLARVCGCRSA